MECPPNGTPRSLHYYGVVVAGISSRRERLSSRRPAECFTNSSADVTGGRACNFYQRADLSSPFLTACLSLFFFPRLIPATPSRYPRSLPRRCSSSGFPSKRLSSSSSRGKYQGTLSGRVFPAYYLSDPTSISGPRAFPCREIMHSPSERRREGRRLPRDRARRGFQDNFLSSIREPALEANSCTIFNARLNVTSAPEKWTIDVEASFLFLSVKLLGKGKRRGAIYQIF